jgi:hypothetical protein
MFGAMFFFGNMWLMLKMIHIARQVGTAFSSGPQPILYGGLAKLAGFLFYMVPIAVVLDDIVDRRMTRADIKAMMSARDVILATRGEYMGGHPRLPHGRFVYLALSGTLEDPQLEIVLPQVSGKKTFSLPVLEVQKTGERREETGEEFTSSFMLANVTFREKIVGERAVLQIEYIGEMGREHVVEFQYFLFGDGEVQDWRNHIVCLQAQSETGKTPYGPWRTLPAGQSA